jgi:hyaluronoglucosaminidase
MKPAPCPAGVGSTSGGANAMLDCYPITPMACGERPTVNSPVHPPLGVIEGFFGRTWSWKARHAYARFLAQAGYDFYIYAPKSDAFLRRRWQEAWPTEEREQLVQLRHEYRHQQVKFGLGLSPFEIHLNPGAEARSQLVRKLQELNALEPDILCLLFDDMRGDLRQLAEIQIELVHLAAEHSNAQQIVFCPSYYSFDPILEKVFGQRPHNYWEDLGQGLDKSIQIFWTGPKVCSDIYPVDHLQEINERLQRPVFLWDNYPVNDGAVKSKLLQLRPVDASHGLLAPWLSGHAVNPMNQPWLSRIPLLSLPRAYREAEHYQAEQVFADACESLCPPPLAQALMEDVHLFQDLGLDKLSDKDKQQLKARYLHWAVDEPCAREVCDWLDGLYAFDPACLTQ